MTASLLVHTRRMARYNRWANRRLYTACAAIAPDDYYRKRQSFFGSLHATLNHILVGDRAWLGRFVGRPATEIKALDQMLYADFAGLRVAREAEDERLLDYAERLEDAALGRTIDYATMSGVRQSDPLGPVLMHLFNHQTHHRGQAHDQLSQIGVDPPPLDLILYLRESKDF